MPIRGIVYTNLRGKETGWETDVVDGIVKHVKVT